jgi:acyl-CoA synthetase (AMP-forming)/AMP-acid ligase II
MMTIPTHTMAYLKEGERLYCCLPLYHAAGGVACVCSCLVSGATMVMR